MKYVNDESLNVSEKAPEKVKKPVKKHNWNWLKPVRNAVVAFAIFTVVIGLGYTLAVSAFAQVLYPYESNGSVITVTLNDGTKKVYGSELIGQSYLKMDSNSNYILKDSNGGLYITNADNEYYLDENKNNILEENETKKLGENVLAHVIFQANYMIGRFNQGAPSNSAVTTTIYKETLQTRKAALLDIGYDATYNETHQFEGLPSELITESGSGCDPEINYATAMYQVPMLAKQRGISEDEVKAIINENTKGKFLGIFGTKRVNVLLVNLQLDGLIN